MAQGELSRRWEAERRDGKRAEARLRRGLQDLEEARLSYLSSMTKEQKWLEQEFLKLQKSRSKQKLSVDPGHISMKLTLPLLSSQARSTRKPLPKPVRFSSTHQSPLQLTNSVSGYEGHLPSLKATDKNTAADNYVTILGNSITNQLSISAESVVVDGRESQRKGPTQEETEVAEAKGTNGKLKNLPGKRKPSLGPERLIMDPEAYGVDGHLRTMYTRPDFLKSYAEAKKARYIRHKNMPAWEKELSIQEIFGHKKVMQQSPVTKY